MDYRWFARLGAISRTPFFNNRIYRAIKGGHNNRDRAQFDAFNVIFNRSFAVPDSAKNRPRNGQVTDGICLPLTTETYPFHVPNGTIILENGDIQLADGSIQSCGKTIQFVLQDSNGNPVTKTEQQGKSIANKHLNVFTRRNGQGLAIPLNHNLNRSDQRNYKAMYAVMPSDS